MATTVEAGSVAGSIFKVAKFDVTADNDVLLPVGNACIVLGAVFEGLVTALNIDAGVDQTVTTFNVAADETLNVTASGAGAVTLVYVAMPVDGYTTHTN